MTVHSAAGATCALTRNNLSIQCIDSSAYHFVAATVSTLPQNNALLECKQHAV